MTTIRKTRGDDIDAACGQLAGQVQDRTKRRLASRCRGRCRRRAMTMFPEPTMRPHPPHSSPPRSRRATFLLRPLAALSLAVLLGACASKEPAPQPQQPTQPEPPPRIQEAPAATRAQLKQELAAGYYERGQMDVALEELDGAVKLDPNNARIYNVYGLVYTELGENAEGARRTSAARWRWRRPTRRSARTGAGTSARRGARATRSPNSRRRRAIRSTRRPGSR